VLGPDINNADNTNNNLDMPSYEQARQEFLAILQADSKAFILILTMMLAIILAQVLPHTLTQIFDANYMFR